MAKREREREREKEREREGERDAHFGPLLYLGTGQVRVQTQGACASTRKVLSVQVI